MELATYIPLTLLCILSVLLACRRAFVSFPWFFAYVLFAVVADIARFYVHSRPQPYFLIYWSTESGYALLGIGVMYEVYRSVVGHLGRAGWPRLLFPFLSLVSVLLTAGCATAWPASELSTRIMILVLLEIAVRFLEVLMFASLVTLVLALGLQWRQYAFGIATGFGVYSTVALLTTTRFFLLGRGYFFFWAWALIVSYSSAVLIWLWFFSGTERPGSPGGIALPSLEELNMYRRLIRRINR